MPRLHALELIPDDAGEAAVRRDWQALRDAGLPSQLDHPAATNTPHVTVVAVPEISADVERLAVERLAPLLPVTTRASGLVMFGSRQLTLARVVDVTDGVVDAVQALRAATVDHQHPGWLPHLTLCRRLPRDRLQAAADVLGYENVELRLTSLRRWDPDSGTVRTLCTVD